MGNGGLGLYRQVIDFDCLQLKWVHLEEQRLQVGGGDRGMLVKALTAEVSLCSLPT